MEKIFEAHAALQSNIHNWGRLLSATRGALKPAKCFYHLTLFSWTNEGKWQYNKTNKYTDLEITIPLEDGNLLPLNIYLLQHQ
ncbi:hypothetical protein ACHAXA_007714 [Cyclostephanos tholiformis]|uniref:Uncharacterized protein n=1 Tax=Cyclostephanos tholiformis TaxID=382380 RepID=A0ABD3RYA6_9STRA